MWRHIVFVLIMYCSDLLNAYVAISGVFFVLGFLCRGSTACSNQSLVSLDTEESINVEASADPGFTSWSSNLLPSNSSYDCVAAITQYYTDLLFQEALGAM